jgi:hypothetical protein
MYGDAIALMIEPIASIKLKSPSAIPSKDPFWKAAIKIGTRRRGQDETR